MTDTSPPAVDMDALMSTYALWEVNAAALVPGNKDRLLAVLASANITRVIVIFDGEGDSGQIEDSAGFADDAQIRRDVDRFAAGDPARLAETARAVGERP